MSAIAERVSARPIVATMRAPSLMNIIEFGVVYAIFGIAIIFFVTPFVWMFLAAFDPRAGPFIRWPERFTLDNFIFGEDNKGYRGGK